MTDLRDNEWTPSFPRWGYVLLLMAVLLLSRLPQMMSPNLLLDGDECISGLMAKHVSEGKDFPVFLYGQQYGFSLLETLSGAFCFKLFCVGAAPLKFAMLILWAAGVLFYYLSVSAIVGKDKGFWIALLLVFIPAWAVWSMKARAGYVTAFSVSSAVIYAVIRNAGRTGWVGWFVVGAMASLVYFAQPLWIPGLVPIVIYGVWSCKRMVSWVGLLSGISGSTFVLKFLASLNRPYYWPPPPFARQVAICQLPERMFVGLTGYDHLVRSFTPANCIAGLLCLLAMAGGVIRIRRSAKGSRDAWTYVFLLSVFFTLVYISFLRTFPERYLLPLSGSLIYGLASSFLGLLPAINGSSDRAFFYCSS